MREDLLRALWRFNGIALLRSLKIDQRNHCAIDFLVSDAIGTRNDGRVVQLTTTVACAG